MSDTHTGQGKAAGGSAGRDGRFDGFGLARRSAVIEGRVDAAQLPRVSELLATEAGEAAVRYRIAGTEDGAGRPALEIALSGSVQLICQRCLQPFRWPVEQQTLLLLAHGDRELARLDAEDHQHEVVRGDTLLDPVTLVEDELLLTLPYAPRCPESECRMAPVKGDS